jgi:hypothetical protein
MGDDGNKQLLSCTRTAGPGTNAKVKTQKTFDAPNGERSRNLSRRHENPMNNVTGRDAFIVAQALAYAAEAIDRLPLERRQQSHRADMLRLLDHIAPGDAANYFRAEAYRVIGGVDMSSGPDRQPWLRSIRFEA